MAGSNGRFTPTQHRIMALLADGQMHPVEQLRACLNDEMSCENNLSVHLTYLRRKLRPRGQDIICRIISGRSYYAHVRILYSPYNG